ncbi:hypothetical protein J7K43_03300, partial [Candidatus Calescamantes bacterium]|nr:hypothetical protein [Candidatus Calescamantes bacterium]
EYTKRIQIEERYKTLLNIFEHSIRYILFGALVFLSYIFIPKQPIKFYKLSLRVLGYSFTQILAIIINLFGKDAINHFIEVIITRMKIDKRGHKNEI